MKDGYIHVVFVIDESGSMYPSTKDVVEGYNKVIDEQKKVKDGKCTVSLFKFGTEVSKVYVGKELDDIKELEYNAGGLTAMNDGIGTAIDEVGKWLNDTKEEDRPSQVLVAIITDGYENNSKDYTLEKVRDMIKHQEEKYSWKFMYMGCDVTDANYAKGLGIKTRGFGNRTNLKENLNWINFANTTYRSFDGNNDAKLAAMDSYLNWTASEMTANYEKELGKKINGND